MVKKLGFIDCIYHCIDCVRTNGANDVFPFSMHFSGIRKAGDKFRNYYQNLLPDSELRFTYDGIFVGDIGKAIAVQYFKVDLIEDSNAARGYVGETLVYITSTSTITRRNPVFGNMPIDAHQLFFEIDYHRRIATVVYNGPVHILFPDEEEEIIEARHITFNEMGRLYSEVPEVQRLKYYKPCPTFLCRLFYYCIGYFIILWRDGRGTLKIDH